MEQSNNKELEIYLKPDDPIRNQEWVCLSIVTPETVKNCKVRAIKIRGVYASENEAKARCKELNEKDPNFNIYIAQMGVWVPWVDDPEKADDVVYANDELNNLMSSYKKDQKMAKDLHEKRREELVQKNINEVDEKDMKEKNNKTSNDVENNDTVVENNDNVVENNDNVVENNDNVVENNDNVVENNEKNNLLEEIENARIIYRQMQDNYENKINKTKN